MSLALMVAGSKALQGGLHSVQQREEAKLHNAMADFNNTMNNISTQNQANATRENIGITRANAMKQSMSLQQSSAAASADAAVMQAATGATGTDAETDIAMATAFHAEQIDINAENQIKSLNAQQRGVEAQNIANRQAHTPESSVLQGIIGGGLQGALQAQMLGLFPTKES